MLIFFGNSTYKIVRITLGRNNDTNVYAKFEKRNHLIKYDLPILKKNKYHSPW